MEKKSIISASIFLLTFEKFVRATDIVDQKIQDVISSVVSDPSKLMFADFEQGKPASHAEPADRKYGQD